MSCVQSYSSCIGVTFISPLPTNTYYNDLWAWTPGGEWTKLGPPNNSDDSWPPPVYGFAFSALHSPKGGAVSLVVYGGYVRDTSLVGLWMYSLQQQSWTKVNLNDAPSSTILTNGPIKVGLGSPATKLAVLSALGTGSQSQRLVIMLTIAEDNNISTGSIITSVDDVSGCGSTAFALTSAVGIMNSDNNSAALYTFGGLLVNYSELSSFQQHSYITNQVCTIQLSCPPGQFSPKFRQSLCSPCPQGWYNPSYAQTSCMPCPTFFTTATTGATNSSQCNQCDQQVQYCYLGDCSVSTANLPYSLHCSCPPLYNGARCEAKSLLIVTITLPVLALVLAGGAWAYVWYRRKRNEFWRLNDQRELLLSNVQTKLNEFVDVFTIRPGDVELSTDLLGMGAFGEVRCGEVFVYLIMFEPALSLFSLPTCICTT